MSTCEINIISVPESKTLNTHLSQHVEKEVWFTSVLAQLEIWSCFQGEEEPLFKVVTPFIEALKPEWVGIRTWSPITNLASRTNLPLPEVLRVLAEAGESGHRTRDCKGTQQWVNSAFPNGLPIPSGPVFLSSSFNSVDSGHNPVPVSGENQPDSDVGNGELEV